MTLTDKTVLDRDGYEYSGQTREVSGETYYLYYTTEYMKTLWDSYEENHGMVYDESMALAVPESEAVVQQRLSRRRGGEGEPLLCRRQYADAPLSRAAS